MQERLRQPRRRRIERRGAQARLRLAEPAADHPQQLQCQRRIALEQAQEVRSRQHPGAARPGRLRARGIGGLLQCRDRAEHLAWAERIEREQLAAGRALVEAHAPPTQDPQALRRRPLEIEQLLAREASLDEPRLHAGEAFR
jgi:hypothetical protein